ncbi:hypothetical protein QQS21_010109 [Conoideocrella luteorostrata]|uniref:Uncharacterized protein n=1 Tax=Conoideocrella luteorostrata TaxID=1105319 RepID=A0AAJ0CFP1_9HYPO|nr:hypothetical protein QQS21_010109 [Conoideocrella luteorostrata]
MLTARSPVSASMGRRSDASRMEPSRPTSRRIKRQLPTTCDDRQRQRDVNVRVRLGFPHIDHPGPAASRSTEAITEGSDRLSNSRLPNMLEYKPVKPHGWDEITTYEPMAARKYEISQQSFTDLAPRGSVDQPADVPSRKRSIETSDSDFDHAGSWFDDDSTEAPDQRLHLDNGWDSDIPLEAPDAPVLCNIGTPELSPMASELEFCCCCEKDADATDRRRINETWHLSCRRKTDAQLEWAIAYMEKVKSGACR